MKRSLIIGYLTFVTQAVLATDLSIYKPKVEVQRSKQAFEFVINIPKDIKYNFKAPWKLQINGDILFQGGKKFKMTSKAFVNNRFTVPVAKDAKGSSNYKLNYYLCDKKGTICKAYRARSQTSSLITVAPSSCKSTIFSTPLAVA